MTSVRMGQKVPGYDGPIYTGPTPREKKRAIERRLLGIPTEPQKRNFHWTHDTIALLLAGLREKIERAIELFRSWRFTTKQLAEWGTSRSIMQRYQDLITPESVAAAA
jgi:hypothetical protein